MLRYHATTRQLLKGDASIAVRAMTENDIPAMRRLDDEICAGLDIANGCRAPGNESCPGGPWAKTETLYKHFRKYQESGNIILLAEDMNGKLIGFIDLWASDEPEPFGKSLNAECIDFLWEYYSLGLEVVLLQEAEKVAISAGLPALDIGTNTSSGDYPSLRRFGMSLFYEYDKVWCDCQSIGGLSVPRYREISRSGFDRSGLLRVSHWCPTDFEFELGHEAGQPGVYEFHVDGLRVVADFWRLYALSPQTPIDCELYVPPSALSSPQCLTRILNETAVLASQIGAETIPLPCPSGVQLESPQFRIDKREFAFAWMRKRLQADT